MASINVIHREEYTEKMNNYITLLVLKKERHVYQKICNHVKPNASLHIFFKSHRLSFRNYLRLSMSTPASSETRKTSTSGTKSSRGPSSNAMHRRTPCWCWRSRCRCRRRFWSFVSGQNISQLFSFCISHFAHDSLAQGASVNAQKHI